VEIVCSLFCERGFVGRLDCDVEVGEMGYGTNGRSWVGEMKCFD
jgi:hypothetical protein